MAQNSLGRNMTFSIYNANGTKFHDLELKKASVESVVMSLGDKIEGEVYYKDNALQVTMQEYVKYNDVNYVLVSPPTVVREGMVADNSQLKGMTKYAFTFYHPMYMLGNFPFTDIAVTQDEAKYLSQNNTFAWIGTLFEFVAKLNANLKSTEWLVVANIEHYETDEQGQPTSTETAQWQKASALSEVLQFDKQFISDALKKAYETWDIPFTITPTTQTIDGVAKKFKIEFGLPSQEIYTIDGQGQQTTTPFVFQFGKGVGLKNNSRTPRNNKIITRIVGSGSDRNVPFGYPQIIWYGNQEWDYTIENDPSATNSYPIYDGIVGGQSVRLIKHPFTRSTLMPSVYVETVNNKVNPLLPNGDDNPYYNANLEIRDYYDAIDDASHTYPNNINTSAPSVEVHQFEDIYPRLSSDSDYKISAVSPYDGGLELISKTAYGTIIQQLIAASSNYNEKDALQSVYSNLDWLNNSSNVGGSYTYQYVRLSETTYEYGVWYHIKYTSANVNFEYNVWDGTQAPQINVEWDDSTNDEGEYKQSYFKLTLPTLSFDLYACAAVTQEMNINMRSGQCLGCTFPIQVDWEDYKANFYDADGNFDPVIGEGHPRNGSKYPNSSQGAITVIVQKDTDTFGTLMPNVYQQPAQNDSFVILGISLPMSYVTDAEEELDDAMKEYMLENNVHYYDYPLKFDEYFLANNIGILEQIQNNNIVRFEYAGTEMALSIKSITIQYGDGVLPKYDITLTDDIEIVLNKIGQVTDDVSRLRVQLSELQQYYSGNILQELQSKLSRIQDDVCQGRITFQQGLDAIGSVIFHNEIRSPQFETGLYEGRGWRIDNLGNAEFESARVRSYLEIVELLVNRLQAQEGDTLFTDNDQIERVEKRIVYDNFLLDSSTRVENTDYLIAKYRFSRPPQAGKTYRFTVHGQLGEGRSMFRLYNSSASCLIKSMNVKIAKGDTWQGTSPWTTTDSHGDEVANDELWVYQYPSSGTGASVIEWITMEEVGGEYATYILSLKEKYQGYVTGQMYGNVIKGIINTLAAKQAGISDYTDAQTVEVDGSNTYYTSWMHVIGTHNTDANLGVNQIQVVLYSDDYTDPTTGVTYHFTPAGKNFVPCELMTIARWGCKDYSNPQDPDYEAIKASIVRRQRMFMISTTDGRVVKYTGVDSPILQEYNYGVTIGELPDFVKNYTEVRNVLNQIGEHTDWLYAQGVVVGNFIKVDTEGKPEVNIVDCGMWVDGSQVAQPTPRNGVYLYNEWNSVSQQYETHDVWHNNSKWRCLHHQPDVIGGVEHYYEPTDANRGYWLKLESGVQGQSAQYIYLKGTARDASSNQMLPAEVRVNGGSSLVTNPDRSLNLVTLNRQTLAVVETGTYDTWGQAHGDSGVTGITSLISKINSLDNSVFICLVSYDAVGWNSELITTLQGCGMDDLPYTALGRYPFLFLGYKGLGKGNGYTRMNNVGSYLDVVELAIYVAGGAFTTKDGKSGVDAQDVEWAYIRTQTNAAPVITSDSTYVDSNGRGYASDHHLPHVTGSAYIENNASNYQCTQYPKGVNDTWKYEWEIMRTKGAAVNGKRTWNYYTGMMTLHNNLAEGAYIIDTDNDNDQFGTDSNSYVQVSQERSTKVTVYDGSTIQTLSNLSVVLQYEDGDSIPTTVATASANSGTGVVTVTIQQNTTTAFSHEAIRAIITASVTGKSDKQTVFTIRKVMSGQAGLTPIIYNLNPTNNDFVFNRGTDGVTLTPASRTTTINALKTVGNTTTNASTVGDSITFSWGFDNDAATQAHQNLALGTTITVTNSDASSHYQVWVQLSSGDRETLSIIKDGEKGGRGSDGANARAIYKAAFEQPNTPTGDSPTGWVSEYEEPKTLIVRGDGEFCQLSDGYWSAPNTLTTDKRFSQKFHFTTSEANQRVYFRVKTRLKNSASYIVVYKLDEESYTAGASGYNTFYHVGLDTTNYDSGELYIEVPTAGEHFVLVTYKYYDTNTEPTADTIVKIAFGNCAIWQSNAAAYNSIGEVTAWTTPFILIEPTQEQTNFTNANLLRQTDFGGDNSYWTTCVGDVVDGIGHNKAFMMQPEMTTWATRLAQRLYLAGRDSSPLRLKPATWYTFSFWGKTFPLTIFNNVWSTDDGTQSGTPRNSFGAKNAYVSANTPCTLSVAAKPASGTKLTVYVFVEHDDWIEAGKTCSTPTATHHTSDTDTGWEANAFVGTSAGRIRLDFTNSNDIEVKTVAFTPVATAKYRISASNYEDSTSVAAKGYIKYVRLNRGGYVETANPANDNEATAHIVDTSVGAFRDGVRLDSFPANNNHIAYLLGEEWTYHTYTFKTRSDFNSAVMAQTHTFQFRLTRSSNYTYVCMPKLEEGLAATTYDVAANVEIYGKTDRFYYFAGKFNDFANDKSWDVSDVQAPYFLYENPTTHNETYWIFSPENNGTYTKSQMGTPSSSSAYWRIMTNDFKYIITEAIFGAFAHFGGAIINGDWLISQYGIINGSASTAFTSFDPAMPKGSMYVVENQAVNASSTITRTLSLTKGKEYNFNVSVYWDLSSGTTTATTFTIKQGSTIVVQPTTIPWQTGSAKITFTPIIDGDYTISMTTAAAIIRCTILAESSGAFIPNYAVDLLTGKTYMQNAEISGNVAASSVVAENESMVTSIEAGALSIRSKSSQSYGVFALNSLGEVVLQLFDKDGGLLVNLGGSANSIVYGEWIETKMRSVTIRQDGGVNRADAIATLDTCTVYFTLKLGQLRNANQTISYYDPDGVSVSATDAQNIDGHVFETRDYNADTGERISDGNYVAMNNGHFMQDTYGIDVVQVLTYSNGKKTSETMRKVVG